MGILYAVLLDLTQFAYEALLGPIEQKHTPVLPPGVWHMNAPTSHIALSAPGTASVPHTLHQKALDAVFAIPPITPQRNTIIYTATTETPLRTSPHVGVDNLIRRIPYGAMLVALETEGHWTRVFHRGTEGWVSLDDIVDKAAYVYPTFVIGESNMASDPNTERIRAMIGDEFSCGEGDLPLQAEEYVLYKLVRAGAAVVWKDVRPRIAGTWASTIDVSKHATISTTPSPRSVIEWRALDGRGHVAFVETVSSDESIYLSEANWPERGIYNERTLVQEEWQQLTPVFISFM
jgi:hypothetical protein